MAGTNPFTLPNLTHYIDKRQIELYNAAYTKNVYHCADERFLHMELRKIQFFLHIVESGSLSKAASRLYLTQPTLSRFLAKLEEEVGQPLFRRSRSASLELTEAGEVYLETAKQINELWTSMDSKLKALKENGVSHIRVGIDSDPLYSFLQNCANTLTQQYPNVLIETHTSDSAEIQAKIAEGKLDVGLASYTEFNPALTYVIAARNEVDLVVNKTNPLAQRSYQIAGQENARISLGELSPRTPFLMIRENTVLRKTIDLYMEKMRFTPLIRNTYLLPNAVPDMMHSGEDLVALCPRNHFYPDLAYIALDPPVFFSRGICFRKNWGQNPAESRLIELLKGMPVKYTWSNR